MHFFIRSIVFASALAAVAFAGSARAQVTVKIIPEFASQGMLIVNFNPRSGTDYKVGKRAADAVRSRVSSMVNKREIDVVDGGKIHDRMFRADYNADSTFTIADIHALNQFFRTDEYLVAYVASSQGNHRISGEIVLARDERVRQPLVEVRAPTLDSAASLFAKSVVAASTQLVPQRRCENALHEGAAPRALTASRAAIAVYPRSTIARTCLVWTLARTNAPARDVLYVAQEILAIDSTNFHALEAAATALDSLKRRDEAASMYFRMAATDTGNIALALRISYSLLDGQNTKRGEPFITRISDAHPDNIPFLWQKWRATYENRNWNSAIDAGEAILERDPAVKTDSTFYLRLGSAYNATGKPVRAVEILAHAVAAFPKDSRIYTLYTQYIRTESDSVIPRGLSLFPSSADLLAMNAKDLRAKGKIAESLDATKRAIALDSTLSQGRLVVAQLEMELGRPDSALSSLRRAVASGEDSTVVSQFALARGNALYRAASTTKQLSDFELAYRFLSFADTVHTSTQSKFLMGVAALGIAQTALTESAKTKDKVEGCRLTHIGTEVMSVAQIGIAAGMESFGEMAKPSNDYLQQLKPYAAQQLKNLCDEGVR